jgi:hypothetical protein
MMDRRGFLYRITRGKAAIQSVFVWSVLISVIILVLKFDWFNDLTSFLNIFKLLDFLLAIIVGLVIALLIVIKITELIIPSDIIEGVKKNDKLINYITTGLLLGYIIYHCYSKGNYNLLILPSIILLWQAYLRWNEKQGRKEKTKQI